jgi:hypothetical protein
MEVVFPLNSHVDPAVDDPSVAACTFTNLQNPKAARALPTADKIRDESLFRELRSTLTLGCALVSTNF